MGDNAQVINRVGDVLLFDKPFIWYAEILGLIQTIMDNKARHAEIARRNLPGMHVYTLGTNFDGVKYRDQVVDKYVAVVRARFDIDEFKMALTIDRWFDSNKDKKQNSYSYFGLANAAIQQGISRIVRVCSVGLLSWKKCEPVKIGDRPFCSKQVAEIYEMYNGYRFKRNGVEIPADVVTPGDIYACEDFVIIKDFG